MVWGWANKYLVLETFQLSAFIVSEKKNTLLKVFVTFVLGSFYPLGSIFSFLSFGTTWLIDITFALSSLDSSLGRALAWKLRVGILLGSNTGKGDNPPASEASREVANLTEIKNPHIPVHGVKEFVCLSVTKFDPIISELAKRNGLKCKKACFKFFCSYEKWPVGPGRGPKQQHFDPTSQPFDMGLSWNFSLGTNRPLHPPQLVLQVLNRL